MKLTEADFDNALDSHLMPPSYPEPTESAVCWPTAQPMAAEPATSVGEDECPTPAGWFRHVGGYCVLALAVAAAIALICLSPTLPVRQ